MGVVLAHAENRYPTDHAGDPEPRRQDRRVQRRLARLGHTGTRPHVGAKRVTTIDRVGSSTRIDGRELSDGDVELLLSCAPLYIA